MNRNAATDALSYVIKVEKPKMIEFNPKWSNGTGYFDGAVSGKHAPVLEPGTIVQFVTPEPNKRRGLIISTIFGNVVVFERYPNGEDGIVAAVMPTISKAKGPKVAPSH